MRAPAARYSASLKPLPSPAPRSTITAWPAETSGRTPSGTIPTRNSWSLSSRGTPRWVGSGLGAVRLDQDLGRLRPHDPRVRLLSGAELLADLGPGDRHRLLVRVALGKVDAAHRRVVGRESDLARAQVQLSSQLLEDLLRVEVAPDRLAVLEGRVGVLAPDHQVREAVVLAVDRVHDRLARPAVEHLHVEADQLEDVVQVVADRVPERRVLVAFAEEPAVVQDAVGAHARHRGDVVLLELPHQRVQHDAGEMTLAGEALRARDERVLVGAVQGVARLEGERALPLPLADQRARHARREDVLAVLRVEDLRERA